MEEGFVTDRASLVAWLETVLAGGTGAVDGALFAAAWRAAEARDWPAFDAIAERAAAWRGTSEMALELRQQGGSFLSITRTAWPHADLDAAHERLAGEIALPVAVALAAAAHGIALGMALRGYLHAFAANLISAAVRAVPLGQTDGQRALAGLEARCGAPSRRRWRSPISTRSARRRRCSTGARCATKPSTRGSSAHERAARLPPVRDRVCPVVRPFSVEPRKPLAGGKRGRLARAVIGDGRRRMPPRFACLALSLVLAMVALWPLWV